MKEIRARLFRAFIPLVRARVRPHFNQWGFLHTGFFELRGGGIANAITKMSLMVTRGDTPISTVITLLFGTDYKFMDIYIGEKSCDVT